MSTARTLLSVGLAAAFTVGGIAISQPSQAATSPTTSPRGDVSAKLHWRDCPSAAAPTLQCATLRVPMDYSRPHGRSFKLAVVRIPATGKKLGSLFFNPGGPGGSGTSSIANVAPFLSASVKASFDFVSWDPRGIGQTIPALKNCAQPPIEMPVGPQVDWASVQHKAARKLAAANRICQHSNKSFINSIGTNNVVRDLDRLRIAVGDDKLNFWGPSYGSHIGYLYALKYPNRIRSLVLDGNMSPVDGFMGIAAEGGLAPDSALQFMRNNYPAGYNAITSTADSLNSNPVPLGEGVLLTRWTWLSLMMSGTGQERFWPTLPDYAELVQVARDQTEEGAEARALLLKATTAPDSNAGGAFSAVECIDYPQRMTNAQQLKLTRRNAAKAPWFGGMLTLDYSRGCAGLKLKPDPIPLLSSAANRARLARVKVLISNATHDGETPMVWAHQMLRGFNSAAFVRYRGGQHAIWNFTQSSCVNATIDRYVLTGRQPRKQTTCPFSQPTSSTTQSTSLNFGPLNPNPVS